VDADGTVGQYFSTPIRLQRNLKLFTYGARLRPRNVSWSLYWPEYNRKQTMEYPGPLDPPDPPNPQLPPDSETLLAEPSYLIAPDYKIYTDPVTGDKIGDGIPDPISIDIAVADSNGSGELWYSGGDKDLMLTLERGSFFEKEEMTNENRFTIDGDQTFKYTILFNLERSQAVYQAPVLDDITFTFYYSRPRILMYQRIN